MKKYRNKSVVGAKMRKRHIRKEWIKLIIAIVLILLGIVVGLYVGAWLMFIKPIIACCVAFDAGTLTAVMIGKTVLKCVFASFIAGIIIFIFSTVSGILLSD